MYRYCLMTAMSLMALVVCVPAISHAQVVEENQCDTFFDVEGQSFYLSCTHDGYYAMGKYDSSTHDAMIDIVAEDGANTGCENGNRPYCGLYLILSNHTMISLVSGSFDGVGENEKHRTIATPIDSAMIMCGCGVSP